MREGREEKDVFFFFFSPPSILPAQRHLPCHKATLLNVLTAVCTPSAVLTSRLHPYVRLGTPASPWLRPLMVEVCSVEVQEQFSTCD